MNLIATKKSIRREVLETARAGWARLGAECIGRTIYGALRTLTGARKVHFNDSLTYFLGANLIWALSFADVLSNDRHRAMPWIWLDTVTSKYSHNGVCFVEHDERPLV